MTSAILPFPINEVRAEHLPPHRSHNESILTFLSYNLESWRRLHMNAAAKLSPISARLQSGMACESFSMFDRGID